MKLKNIFLFIWGFLAAGAVFAQFPGYIFPNVGSAFAGPGSTPSEAKPTVCIGSFDVPVTINNKYDASTGNLWISQDAEFCENVRTKSNNPKSQYTSYSLIGIEQLSSLSETDEVLGRFLNEEWLGVELSGSNIGRIDLYVLSDFDFGQYDPLSEDKSCIKNHTPLPFRNGEGSLNGAGFTMRNLCFEGRAADMNKKPLGLFGDIVNGSVKHLNLANVKFTVAVSENETVKIPPVGAFVGRTSESLFEDDSIADITINAPYAGAFAGYVQNSTIGNIRADDDIFVYNTSNVGPGATFYDLDWTAGIKVFLGGVAGVSSDGEMVGISMVAKIQDSSDVTNSAIGGLAGLGVVGQSRKAFQTSLKIRDINFFKRNERTYTKIMGGRFMGGFFGHVALFKNTLNSQNISNINIDKSSFVGNVFHGVSDDSVFAGGMVGFSNFVNGGLLKIESSFVDVTIKDSINDLAGQYFAGGFVGLATGVGSNASSADKRLKITSSKAQGKIYVGGFSGEEGSDVYLGGFAGKAVFSVASDALNLDTSFVVVKSGVEGANANLDNVHVGGFVGAIPKIGQNSILKINSVVFKGSVTASSVRNNVRMGGIVGSSTDLSDNSFIAFKNAEVFYDYEGDDADILVLNAKKSKSGDKASVGGICGSCTYVDTLYRTAVNGDISVKGAFAGDSLLVGGLLGSVSTHYGANLSPNYFIGDINVNSQADESGVKSGFLFGYARFSGNKESVEIKSNYHFGKETLTDLFGVLWSTKNVKDEDKTDSWKNMSNKDLKWEFAYNFTNGETETIFEPYYNGLVAESFIKSSEFKNLLDDGLALNEKEWAWARGVNGNLPYFKGQEDSDILKIGGYRRPPSPLPPNSSSSEVVQSSSSEPAPASSSEEAQSSSSVPVPASSSEETQSSSNVPAPASSSEEAKSSSNVPVPASSSEEAQSSSNVPVPASSSEEAQSSSNVPAPASSSEEAQSSSSKVFVAKFVRPEILSKRVDVSDMFARFSFGVRIDSTAGKVTASLRVRKDGKTIYDNVVMDSVPETTDRVPASLVSLPAGKLSYEFMLSCDSAKVKTSGEFVLKPSGDKAFANAWQMVSIADLDFESLVLDDRNSLYWWNEAVEFGEYWQYQAYSSNEVAPGTRGYWFGTFDGTRLSRTPQAYVENAEIVWNLDSIHSGWNMVANPYGWNVDVSSLADSFEIWNWNAEKGKYEQNYELKPYEAVWVKASGKQEIRIPAVSASAKGLAKKSVLAENGDGWTIRATLYDEFGKDDSWNMFGVKSSTYESEEPPAGMGDYVSFSFMEGKRVLAKSFKPAAEEMEWTARISASSERDVFLKLDGVEEAMASGNKVFVTIDGNTVEMKDGKSIRVELGRGFKTATIRVAPGPRAELEYALNGVRTFQSGSAFEVQFSATNGLSGSAAKVDLLDVGGRVVASASVVASEGVNSVTMPAPKQGLYVLRVHAGSRTYAKNILLR